MDAGHRVFFNFTDLDLEGHSSCSFDYVAVSSWPFCVHMMNLMLTVATFEISWYNRPMHHSLNQFMDKLLLSRSMMVTMSLLHSWVNFVESPGLLPLRPQGTSSMFASGQITVRTVKASVPSSQKVSAVFVLWICHGLFHCLTSLITQLFPACGSTIAADDVGGEIASPRYPYSYPPNQNCSWIIQAQEPCKSAGHTWHP